MQSHVVTLQNSNIEVKQDEKKVYSRTLRRVIDIDFNLDIVSLKDPPVEADDFGLIKEKLLDLIKSLPSRPDNIFTVEQQKILLNQVNSLVETPPFVLCNAKEREAACKEHKQTLIDVYQVISQPKKKNFNVFEEKIKTTKKQASNDKLVAIRCY